MVKECSRVTRQNRVRQYLQNLEPEKVVEIEPCDTGEGFEKNRGLIANFAPQAPSHYRFEEVKLEYQYVAVFDPPWTMLLL